MPLTLIIVTFIVVGFFKLIALVVFQWWNISFTPQKIYNSISKSIFWNHFIRLFIEEYIIIAMAGIIKLFAFDLSNYFEIISSIFAVLIVMIVVITPIIVWRFLYKKHDEGILH